MPSAVPTPEGTAPDLQTEPSAPSDWIVAIGKHRDKAAFAVLFTQFAPQVKAYFLRFGVLEERAEEFTQDTFLMIWRKADRFDPTQVSVAGWIFTIARNLRIDALRHERRPDPLPIAPPAPPPETPEQALGAKESRELMRGAMVRLPEAQAEVVRLAYFEEMSHSEIARILGLPLGTVKSRIRLAAAQLRAALSP